MSIAITRRYVPCWTCKAEPAALPKPYQPWFVVSSEITAWGGPQQRNQPYMDGGLYAMMLMLALDAKGFMSCPLNLAIGNRTERTIKQVGSIPPRERLIVMIAAGTQPDHPIRAANSPRLDADAICQIHD